MINIPKIFKNQENESKKTFLPLLPLRDIVVFPHVVAPLFVERNKSINALSSAVDGTKEVFLATQGKATIDKPDKKDINVTGVISKVLQLIKLPDGTVKTLVEGMGRARIDHYISNEDYFEVEVIKIADEIGNIVEVEALSRGAVAAFKEYSFINSKISKELVTKISSLTNHSELSDIISSHFAFKISDKQQLIESYDVAKRLSILIELINMEIEIFKMNNRIKGRIKNRIDKAQKYYYLNEQMRAIKQEMGTEDEDEVPNEMKEFENKIKNAKMPKKAATKVDQEFKKLKLMTPMSAEATVVRNYIDLLISLPWLTISKIQKNITKAEQILNEDHYGLNKPKERILEYLAVQTLVKKMNGPILCLIGPPGVGKTSLAKSVARATNRKFVRLSLGGLSDEAEIRGHRRTYVGAMPGKIMQSLKKIGVNNPVMCLDEIDKMGTDFRGDPSSALLEVLDPEQNYAFNDHYLDLDYDLSEILFITTANSLQNIPLPLRDRMEILHLSSYTEYEKHDIAKAFLVPKQIKNNGLSLDNINFSNKAIYKIIRSYTREAGVRNLEREISAICRKVAHKIIKDKSKKKHNITTNTIKNMLGIPKYNSGQIEKESKIGLVTGLAWTQTGGELLGVETLSMPGTGKLSITGKLGDVMKESVKAAVSFVRSKAIQLSIDENFYEKLDIHIHIPEGAIPKDGPSAGASICTSIVSSLLKLPVDNRVAMTGEITLRGRILPIGGLKEKILAAHRGGISKVIIPIENKRELKSIPKTIIKQLEIVFVEHMDEVLAYSFVYSNRDEFYREKFTSLK